MIEGLHHLIMTWSLTTVVAAHLMAEFMRVAYG